MKYSSKRQWHNNATFFSIIDCMRNKTLFVLLALVAIFTACEKDAGLIGSDIQPPGSQPGVFSIDTFDIRASYALDDSIPGSKTISSLVGELSDPVFGYSRAEFATQLRLPANNIDFDPTASIDSAFLYLVYYQDGFYGSDASPVGLEVRELLEYIEEDSSYTTEISLDYGSEILGQVSVTPTPDDTTMRINGQPAPAHVKIPISNSFVQRIFDASGTQDLASNDDFLQFINGIYLTSNSGNAIFYFDLLNEFSNLTIYYSTASTDTNRFQLLLNNECQRINRFEHDYSGTMIDLDNPGDNLQESYCRAMGGIKMTFDIPGLDSLRDKNFAINNAELLVHVSPGFSPIYPVPESMFIVLLDSTGNNLGLIDQTEPGGFIGGSYDEDNNLYRFNIPRHIHRVLNEGEENLTFAFVANTRSISGNSVVLAGGSYPDPQYRMKLRITYTQPE